MKFDFTSKDIDHIMNKYSSRDDTLNIDDLVIAIEVAHLEGKDKEKRM